MCGIAGLLQWRKPVVAQAIRNAIAALHHRGPDGEGYWFADDGSVAFGHARLGIMAPENSVQPMTNETGTIVAVVNGEFYGYESIRAELIEKGHRFRTQTDSEILIHLYEEYGVECLKELRGEFAFALWDDTTKRLFAARDRFGIKPLCYTESDEGFLFASEAKALFAMGHEAAWNKDAFFSAASLQYTLPDQTLFADIKQLPPGHFMLVCREGIKIARYWDLDWPSESAHADCRHDQDYIDHFKELLSEAIRLRMRSDVPICCHLSGGLDSSSILGFMNALGQKPVSCFTVCFDLDAYNEEEIADETAQSLGAKYYRVPVSQSDILDAMPAAVRNGEGLAINGHISAKYLLNKSIRQNGYKVALTGEGADEVLMGYPHFREDLARLSKAPSQKIDQLYAMNQVLQGVQLPSGQGLSTERIQASLGFVPTFLAAKATLGFKLFQNLSDDFVQSVRERDAYGEMLATMDIHGQLRGKHPVNQSSYLWSKLTLANYILRTLGDGMEMAHSVEGRLPFLDHKLVEFLRTVPLQLKIRNGIEKYILREAAKPVVTETVYKRQKHSFMAPPLSLFADSRLRDSIKQILISPDFSQRTFFSAQKMRTLVDKFDDMNSQELTSIEPVIMMGLSSYHLAEAFNLHS